MLKCNFKKSLTLVLVSIMMVLLMAPSVFAGVDYDTKAFDVEVLAKVNNEYNFTETISVDFHGEKHGIFRFIPENLGKMKIKDIFVEDETYTVYEEDGNTVIRIGDEDEYVSGKKTYKISYTIAVAEDKNPEKDLLYLDILPTNWQSEIDSTKILLTFEKPLQEENLNIYTGKYGEEETDIKVNVNSRYTPSEKTLKIDGKDLPEGVGITVQSDLQEGYWENPYNYNEYKKMIPMVLAGFMALIVLLWILFGRDPKIIETVEFYPPENLTSAEIGYIIDGHLEKKDMISLVFYLAEKGYINIEEKNDEIKLIKKKEIAEKEKSFVKVFMNGIFKGNKKSINIEEMGADFAESYATARELLINEYEMDSKKIYENSSKVARAFAGIIAALMPSATIVLGAIYASNFIMMISAIPVLIVSIIGCFMVSYTFDKKDAMKKSSFKTQFAIFFIVTMVAYCVGSILVATLTESLVLGILVIVSGIISLPFLILMRKRSKQSVALVGKILGLKTFIETAELPRLEMLVNENPNYFMNILPYAYVMGLSNKWTDKFKDIDTAALPDWYVGSGNIDMFDIYFMSRMMSRMNTSIDTVFIPEGGDSGSGGFGGGFGGGFSGGGFGGGGGGAW